MNKPTLFVGIDISKLKHDVVILDDKKRIVRKPFIIQEERKDYQKLLGIIFDCQRKLDAGLVVIGMESTADYWKNLFYFLEEESDNFQMVLINPVQTLVRQIQNHNQEINTLNNQLLEQFSHIQDEDSILTSLDHVIQKTAVILESYFGDVNRFYSDKAFVAYFGMNPIISESGNSKKRKSRLEKKGSGLVRQKLYMIVLSIIRQKKEPIYSYYIRLIESGKPKMVAIGAAMRKLLVIMYYMLKNKTPFDPNYENRK